MRLVPSPPPAGPVEAAQTAEVRPKAQSRPSDREIAALAARQHGAVTLAQVERLGLSGRALRHRVASGRMRRVHRGVYASWTLGREGRWMAALLAVGCRARLSHRSAAALWDICADDPAVVHVTLPQPALRSREEIAVHGGSTLRGADCTTRAGIPCTTLGRTLIDFAAQVDRRTLERAVDRAEMLRIFDLREIEATLERERGRRGAAALKRVLAAYAEPALTRNDVEEQMLAISRRAKVPRPAVNVWIPLTRGRGYRPDFLWRDARVIVEVDGRSYHARRAAFEHDRRRDRELALAGFATYRYAASEVVRQPGPIARELRRLLAARSH
jgi:predicted transcriptional regulator of viral defense system